MRGPELGDGCLFRSAWSLMSELLSELLSDSLPSERMLELPAKPAVEG
ncbi:hypothetical protein P3T29_001139 [Kitasatospora sp. MAP5-34]|nr:hypothetical protein [Kitasatospora sp. MAP5-34]